MYQTASKMVRTKVQVAPADEITYFLGQLIYNELITRFLFLIYLCPTFGRCSPVTSIESCKFLIPEGKPARSRSTKRGKRCAGSNPRQRPSPLAYSPCGLRSGDGGRGLHRIRALKAGRRHGGYNIIIYEAGLNAGIGKGIRCHRVRVQFRVRATGNFGAVHIVACHSRGAWNPGQRDGMGSRQRARTRQ